MSHRDRRGASWALAGSFLAISFGCGGRDAGTTGTGAPGGYEGLCDKALAAKCPGGDRTACLTECRTLRAQCPSQTDRYAGCIQAHLTLTCGASGRATPDPNQLFRDCSAEYSPFQSCAACVTLPRDDACDTCFKANCCTETKAYLGDPQYLDWINCVQTCSTPNCSNDCLDMRPELRSKVEAAGNCQIQNCSNC